MGSWGNFITVVKERENYLARTAGNHAFPWRIAIVAKDDKELLTNEMIYLLAKPQQIKDTDWIRPGKATWEWWHCAILEKAPFPSGHQTFRRRCTSIILISLPKTRYLICWSMPVGAMFLIMLI